LNDHSWRAYCLYLFGLIATEDNVRSICSIDHYQFENKFYNHQIQVCSQAFDCHRKAFSIRAKHLPADHFRFGTTYNNVGEVYTKSLPSQHIDTFRPFKCIVLLAI